MRKYIFIFLVLMLCILPASAQSTLNLPDTAGSERITVTDVSYFQELYNEHSDSSLIIMDSVFYDYADYDTFVCAEDDTLTQLNFEFENIQGDFDFPITFWYEDDTSENMTFSVNTTVILDTPFWTWSEVHVLLKDDLNNTLLEDTTTDFILGETAHLKMSPDITFINSNLNTRYYDDCINSTVFPVRAVTFDMAALNSSIVNPTCRMTYVDNTLTQEFDGFFGWIYSNISKYDDSGTLYHVFLFMGSMWTFVTFGAGFFLTCTWSYLCIGQAFALFYGVMQQRRGVMAMIEGYCRGTYWTLLLPFMFFKFLFTEILRLVMAIGSLIPFT